MSVEPRDRRIAGGVAVAAAFLVGLTLLASFPAPGPAPTFGTLRTLADEALCPGAVLPHNYSGTVSVYGGASPGSVPLNVTYWAQETVSYPGGATVSTTCVNQSATVDPTDRGSFGFSIYPTTVSNCSTDPLSTQPCTTFVGPYDAVGVAPATLPATEFSSTSQNGTTFTVSVEPYLASVRLTPGPTATFSNGAVDALSAEAFTGAGNRTPMAPSFAWTLTGTGWTFVQSASGADVNVTAAPGAGVGNVTVTASLSLSGTTVTSTTSGQLLAVPTAIASAELNRTAVDVGQSVAARVAGSAAGNYTYVASFDPGLGTTTESVPCSATPSTAGTVGLLCSATLGYGSSGVAQPTVTVSNGASVATWTFPEVVVDPRPAVSLTPSTPVGYAMTALPITVTAAAGTGTGPYAEACFSTGAGSTVCDPSAGPTWTFDPVYSRPGNYSALAWAVDAVGVNRSVSATVRIVAPFSVVLAPAPENASAGAPVALTAVLVGGALPARYWWNVSGESTPIATAWASTDGAEPVSFVPALPGFVTVTFAAVDALGTLGTGAVSFPVASGAATEAVAVGLPPSSSVRAGTPFGLAWQATDVGGAAVRDFASAAEIELLVAGTDTAAAGAVNASGVGPLASPLPGWFDVPSSAWIGGALNVSVSCDVAGSIEVTLSVAEPLPGGTGSVGVTVLPDIDQLVLFDPVRAVASARASATLYQVTDRFGNAAPGGSLVVTTSWSGGDSRVLVPVLAERDGGTEAWVNYSVPGASAGTVLVTDLAGAAVLPAIAVPGLEGLFAVFAVVPLAVAVGVGAVVGAVVLRRRPRRPADPRPEADDAELRRLAEGRATIVDLLGRSGPLDLAGLAALWEPPPAPPDLADWVASLLTDGTLDAAFGDRGVARFFLATPTVEAPAVTVDTDALDLAERRRAALEAEWESMDDP